MSPIHFDDIQPGDTLPPLTLPPVNRTMLALFAGASGDHNAVHIDIDYAREAGMPDVFAHGMLSMAWLGRLLTQWVDQRQLRQFGVRFVGITHLGHQITCTARVVEKFKVDGESRVRLEVQTSNQYGEPRVVGDAVVAL
ncbi:MaoC family dehydratase [Paraburkholderia sp. J67]|uniref:MaoC family dehydratase n=1 Tax=Paraburkholderia sp. J67 TaxID=2805435 RepID=UPI002ABDA2DE|nr:MaoC family dehydratase [Paraburkholderia sp. J67]